MPYKCKSGKLYIPCKRGDGIIAPDKPKRLRLFDGMCGGYIDPDDWTTRPVLSDFTLGETLWLEINNTAANRKFAIDAGKPVSPPPDPSTVLPEDYRRMTYWIDFNVLQPFVEAQCPGFLTKVWKHKTYIPVLKLNSIDPSCIKLAKNIDPRRALIGDVGQITSGSYTIGPGGGDNYPTFGGAGGGYAALGNLTGDLTFTNTGNITETAQAVITEALGGFRLLNTSDTPHRGDPTAGWTISVNHQTTMFSLQEEGLGDFEMSHLHTRKIAAYSSSTATIHIQLISAGAHTISLHDLLLDGNAESTSYGVYIQDVTPIVHAYNIVIWEYVGNLFLVRNGNPVNLYENMTLYNCQKFGFYTYNQLGTCRNVISYDNPSNDFHQIGFITGRHNVSSDATGADANWAGAAGVNNTINAVVADDVQSVNDAQSTFCDLTAGGALDGSGEANGITARTTCIRNRAVPGPNGTSRGAAEVPAPAPAATGRVSTVVSRTGLGMR